MAFHVKNMSRTDFEFATQVTDQMDWGLGKEDFAFMMELEPEGCFVLFEDSDRVGIATTVSFDNVGWFGDLIVAKTQRHRGAGSLLVRHALDYLTEKKVNTVGLYAYAERIPFYKRLGFECDSEFMVLKGKDFSSPAGTNIRKAEAQELAEIISFDQSCFGASRRKSLEPIISDRDNLCLVAVEGDHLSGYVVAKVSKGVAELGPLVCRKGQARTAVSLLKTALSRLKGHEVSMFVPEKETTIVSTLMDLGFHENFRVERMFYGSPVSRECICTAESLERG